MTTGSIPPMTQVSDVINESFTQGEEILFVSNGQQDFPEPKRIRGNFGIKKWTVISDSSQSVRNYRETESVVVSSNVNTFIEKYDAFVFSFVRDKFFYSSGI